MTEAEGEVGYPLNRFKPFSFLILTVQRRYFCCGSLLLLVPAVCYTYFCSAIMLMTYFVNFRELNDHLLWKELFIRFMYLVISLLVLRAGCGI